MKLFYNICEVFAFEFKFASGLTRILNGELRKLGLNQNVTLPQIREMFIQTSTKHFFLEDQDSGTLSNS